MAQPLDSRLPRDSRGPDPRLLRPRRRWYGIAVSVVVLFVILAIGGLLASYTARGRAEPEFYSVHETAGQDVRVQVNAGTDYGIYVPEDANGSCAVDADVISLDAPGTGSANTYRQNGVSWRVAASFTAVEDGVVTFRCGVAPAAFGGARDEVAHAWAGGGIVASVACLPCLGFMVGGAIALVTGLRRSSHKKRLLTNPYA